MAVTLAVPLIAFVLQQQQYSEEQIRVTVLPRGHYFHQGNATSMEADILPARNLVHGPSCTEPLAWLPRVDNIHVCLSHLSPGLKARVRLC